MAINAQKSQLMILMPPKDRTNLNLHLNGNLITHQSTMKVLGVTLAEDMKFDKHLVSGKTSMIQAINTKAALLRTIKPFLSQEAIGKVGSSLINSTVLYAAPLWGTTTKTNTDKIQSAQVRAARIVTNKAWQRTKVKTHRQQTLNLLNWPNITQIVTSATLNLTKKATAKKSSTGMNNMFTNIRPKSQRGNPTFRIKHEGKANKSNNTFSVNATTLFNNLNTEMRNPLLTTDSFKSKLKKLSREMNLLP